MTSTLQSHMTKQVALDVAQQAVLTADLQKLLAMNRHQTNQLNSQLLGTPPVEDDMGDIILGDRVTNITSTAPVAPAAPAPAVAPSSVGKTLLTAAAGAALAATGIGLPLLALPALKTLFTSPSTTNTITKSSAEALSVDMIVEPPKE